MRDRRNELLRTVLGGGLGTPAALAAVGWPTGLTAVLVGVAGASLGVTVAFLIELLWDRIADVNRLRARVAELEATADQHAELRKLLEYQLAIANRTIAIQDVDIKVWGDAFNEASSGTLLPLAAILARRDVTIKTRNLQHEIPKP